MTIDMPDAYRGREQSFLKHCVLREYLTTWGRKIGSLGRNRTVRLWFVDCFSGPWQSQDEHLGDTSIDIGLRALEEAAESWRAYDVHRIELRAVFVEKDATAFRRLQEYVDDRQGVVRITTLHGEFGHHSAAIARMLGDDPAFVFVDPTGFKGVAMDFIAPLLGPRMRDVLVNVMFNHINRFKDDQRAFLREQMRVFFGMGDQELPEELDEQALLALYRNNLKQRCGLTVAADIAIPHPVIQRTWFRLVVGGKHSEVLSVFREVEASVMKIAGGVRARAHRDAAEARTGNLGLELEPACDPRFELEAAADRDAALVEARRLVTERRAAPWSSLWPHILEHAHITKEALDQLVRDHFDIERVNPRAIKLQGDDRIILRKQLDLFAGS